MQTLINGSGKRFTLWRYESFQVELYTLKDGEDDLLVLDNPATPTVLQLVAICNLMNRLVGD